MLSYCLRCKKKYRKHKMILSKTMIHQNVLYVVVKNQNLLKTKKQVEY